MARMLMSRLGLSHSSLGTSARAADLRHAGERKAIRRGLHNWKDVAMAHVNLLSQWGVLVIGTPLLVCGIVMLCVSGATYGIRVLQRKNPWDSKIVKSLLILGLLLSVMGGNIAGPMLPHLPTLL